jgi:hypothetical protein
MQQGSRIVEVSKFSNSSRLSKAGLEFDKKLVVSLWPKRTCNLILLDHLYS